MSHRFENFKVVQAQDGDFIIRRRLPPIWQLVMLFCLGGGGILLLAWKGDNWDYNIVFIALAISIIILLAWYTVFFTQRNRDLLLATEFQNALFAGATSLQTQFCLITKQDGTIIYYDPGFQRMFPEFLRMEQRAIDVLLRVGHASEEDRERVFSALNRGVYEKFVLNFTGNDNKPHHVVLSIDPLPRPRGFFLFRGREYVERSQKNETLIQPQSTLFTTLLEKMPIGAYAINTKSEFTFANPALEEWLGYTSGELLSRKFSLQDLIYPPEQRTEHIKLEPFDGDVTLQRKNGSLLHVHIRQEVSDDQHQKIATGIVTLVEEHAPDLLKKKLS